MCALRRIVRAAYPPAAKQRQFSVSIPSTNRSASAWMLVASYSERLSELISPHRSRLRAMADNQGGQAARRVGGSHRGSWRPGWSRISQQVVAAPRRRVWHPAKKWRVGRVGAAAARDPRNRSSGGRRWVQGVCACGHFTVPRTTRVSVCKSLFERRFCLKVCVHFCKRPTLGVSGKGT